MVNRLKYDIPKNILLTIYNSLIQPYISYGILAWGNTHNIYLDKIFLLQKRAMRNITRSHFIASSSPLFKKLGMLNVRDMYSLNLFVFMHKHRLGLLPPVFKEYFKLNKDVHDYNTRNCNDYYVDDYDLTLISKGVRIAGPSNWNELSNQCKQCKTIKTFKAMVKANMLAAY